MSTGCSHEKVCGVLFRRFGSVVYRIPEFALKELQMRKTLSFPVVSRTRRVCKDNDNSERAAQTTRRILAVAVIIATLALLSACGNGIDSLPGATAGALTVQIVQAPPAVLLAGGTAELAANVLNDKANGGVTWSCAPVNACGSFSPTTTGYQITTVYTAPIAPPNGPITPELAYTVTITATSVSDTSQSASVTFNAAQQYAIYLPQGGWFWCDVCASFGVVGSVTLDGLGNVLGGEVDWDASGGGGTITVLPTTGTYTLDATGHGTLSISLGGDFETHGITATSNSHLVIAEEDQFNGYTIGNAGSLDLQTAGPAFSGSQVSGGYSFTLSGFQGISNWNGSWGGIFTADGTATATTPGNITGGIFDENLGNNGGGPGYNSEVATPAAGLPFTGTYTAPDANGRGVITLSTSPDTLGPCGAAPLPTCTQYVYYIVTPEVLRLVVATNTTPAANTGTAYGQGTLATAANDVIGALTGGFIFSYHGSGDNLYSPGGDPSAAAGEFTTDGNGNVTGGIMDLNVATGGGAPAASVATTGITLAGSSYSISGSPRGTFTDPSGQIYNVYLTDPNLNLLDVNNPSGAGGALFLEANNTSAPYGNAIGVMIPQADAATATLAGSYAIQLAMQSNNYSCCNFDGGLTGDFTVSTTTPGTFSGEGDFQGTGPNNATLTTGPLTGTFTADSNNPGHFVGTITTTPSFPFGIGGTTPGTENVDFFVANGSQGFIVETDTVAPVFGVVEAQGTIAVGAAVKRLHAQQQQSHPKNLLPVTGKQRGQLTGQAGSGRE
jgi:hypothetical protein